MEGERKAKGEETMDQQQRATSDAGTPEVPKGVARHFILDRGTGVSPVPSKL